MTRYLITGSGGQLGRDLVRAVEVGGHQARGLTRQELDIADTDAVRLALAAWRPEVVVNCAAWTAVDACEADPALADEINGHAVERLALVCAEASARLVQISTDYVFDGSLERPYDVDDPTGPINAYGASKLLGERALAALGPLGLVVRTSWVFSGHGGNMVATIRRLVDQGAPLRFVDDQFGCPSFTPDLADAVVDLVGAGASGIVHVTNQGVTTWHGFAREVVGRLGGDPETVIPVATADLVPARPARRPRNSALDGRSLVQAGVPLRRHFTEALTTLLG